MPIGEDGEDEKEHNKSKKAQKQGWSESPSRRGGPTKVPINLESGKQHSDWSVSLLEEE